MNFSTRAAMALEHRPHLVEVAGHQLPQRLRVEALADRVEPATSENTMVTTLRASALVLASTDIAIAAIVGTGLAGGNRYPA